MIPNFLVKYKEKVLHTGKYLNVIRECGRDIKYTTAQFEEQKLSSLNGASEAGDQEMQDNIESGDGGSSAAKQKYQFEVYEHIDKAY